MPQRAFSNIWILVILVILVVGGILAWQYWGGKEEVKAPGEEITPQVVSEEEEEETPGIETMEIKIYLNKAGEDDCNCDNPVIRKIPKTEAVARVAIEELIKGPTLEEMEMGYVACLPTEEIIKEFKTWRPKWGDRIMLNSIKIENGIAYVDFSEEINAYGGGSCWVSSIRSSIVNTLKQFPTVTVVMISVEGETEGILQP